MSYININQAKNYYKSFKPLQDTKEKEGKPMHFDNKGVKYKALDLKPSPQKKLKGGL